MQALQDDLGESLGRTHDIGGVHGLVGGHQDKSLHLGLMSRFGGIPGGDDVVVNSLDDVLLDDGHVLVGGGVVNRLDSICLQDVAQTKLVMGVADESDQIDGKRVLIRKGSQFALNVVQGKLGHFEQDEALWAQTNDLPA